MKASLRLAFSAVVISLITFAASGKPLPFLAPETVIAPTATTLLPPVDGASVSKAAQTLPDQLAQFDRQ
jgi:hypothetical protein